MSIYWCYKFSLNEGKSAIHYRKFSLTTKDPVIPTLSLCFKNPFLQDRLTAFGMNEESYLSFLAGNSFDKKILNIDFNSVTMNITDYIKEYQVFFKNGSKQEIDAKIIQNTNANWISNTFNGFIFDRFYKCFSFNIPKIRNLRIFRIKLSNNIFKDGLRPTDHKFSAWIHLPQQLLLASNTEKWTWPYRASKSIYKTRFLVKSFEIYEMRNTRESACNENWKNFNDWALKMFETEVGCRSPYQIIDQYHKMCDSQDQIHQFFNYQSLVADDKFLMPCNTLENLRMEFLETESEEAIIEDFGYSFIGIYFYMSSYKEITNTR